MSKAILSSLQGQYFWWLSIFMDSKLQPVQLYGFSKSRLYKPLGTAIFFRNRFCPVSWILLFLPVHFYGYSLQVWESRDCHQWKSKKFPSLLCPESLEDTAFDAMSSKLADNDGTGGGARTHTVSPPADFESATSTIPSHRHTIEKYISSTAKFQVFSFSFLRFRCR